MCLLSKHQLPEEVEEKVKEAAEISMGTEIIGEDIINIKHLCQQVSHCNLSVVKHLFEGDEVRVRAIFHSLIYYNCSLIKLAEAMANDGLALAHADPLCLPLPLGPRLLCSCPPSSPCSIYDKNGPSLTN